MALDFWLHTFAPIRRDEMLRRLFPASAPKVFDVGMTAEVDVEHGAVLNVYPSDEQEVELFAGGKTWHRHEPQTLVAISLNDDAEYPDQEEQAVNFARRLMDSGDEDVVLSLEQQTVFRRLDGVVERFSV